MLALDAREVEFHLRVVTFGDIGFGLEVCLPVELFCTLEVVVGVGVDYLFEDFGLGDFVEVVRLGLFHLVLEFIFLHSLKFIIFNREFRK